MSDYSQGPGWWQASDGKWYPPQQAAQPAPMAYSAPTAGYPAATKTNGFAIASLVCSLVSCGIGSILAIVFGFMSKRQIRESNGTETGEGLATAGIVIGFIGIALFVAYIIFVVVAVANSDTNDFDNDFGMAMLGLLTAR